MCLLTCPVVDTIITTCEPTLINHGFGRFPPTCRYNFNVIQQFLVLNQLSDWWTNHHVTLHCTVIGSRCLSWDITGQLNRWSKFRLCCVEALKDRMWVVSWYTWCTSIGSHGITWFPEWPLIGRFSDILPDVLSCYRAANLALPWRKKKSEQSCYFILNHMYKCCVS